MAKKIDVNGLDHYHDKVSAMLASEYSSSKTYAVGDYCFHAGTLYECTTAITTAENWTSGHWTAAKLAEDTSALKTAVVAEHSYLNAKTSTYTNLFNQDALVRTGIVSNGTEIIGTNTAFHNVVIPLTCKENTQYSISFKYYCEQNVASTGRGMVVSFVFSDASVATTMNLWNATESYTEVTQTSPKKTITGLAFAYTTAAGNIFHLKDFMLVEGTSVKPYIPYYIPKDNQARDDIASVSHRVGLLEGEIPDYWESTISEKLSTIRTNMGNAGVDGDTFVFVADPHWEANYGKSPLLIKNIANKTNINFMVIGGDILCNHKGDDAKTAAVNEGLNAVDAFKKTGIRVYTGFGNHDQNIIFDDQNEHIVTAKHLTIAETYSSMFKQMEFYGIHYFDLSKGFDYWFDKDVNKTRYIVLDMGEDFSQEGRVWSNVSGLSTVLNATPSGYSIVIFAHIMHYGKFNTLVEPIMDAYNARETYTYDGDTYDYSSGVGTVKIAIGGHKHEDDDWTTDGGVPCVICDCDSDITNSGITPVAGTTTEQAFDVVTLDYTNEKAYFVRIGRGDSREINL